jgi:hypothetical protein
MTRPKFTKRKFHIRGKLQKQSVIAEIEELPEDKEKPLLVTISEPEDKRKLIQNDKFHAMLTDISRQCEWMKRKLEMNQWKVLMVSGHAVATGNGADMIPGLEGEFVNIRESTAEMSISRMASLIEYVTAWGANNNVRWSAPKQFTEY